MPDIFIWRYIQHPISRSCNTPPASNHAIFVFVSGYRLLKCNTFKVVTLFFVWLVFSSFSCVTTLSETRAGSRWTQPLLLMRFLWVGGKLVRMEKRINKFNFDKELLEGARSTGLSTTVQFWPWMCIAQSTGRHISSFIILYRVFSAWHTHNKSHITNCQNLPPAYYLTIEVAVVVQSMPTNRFLLQSRVRICTLDQWVKMPWGNQSNIPPKEPPTTSEQVKSSNKQSSQILFKGHVKNSREEKGRSSYQPFPDWTAPETNFRM